jgi:hypothetical protein
VNSWNLEPVRVAAAVRSVLVCLAVLGPVRLTPEQTAAIVLAVEAVLAVLVRRRVTPERSRGEHRRRRR